ncbi:MAG: D-alanyl-D-alaninecarboxypeptidase/D-alanyl-D-al anine-endopeptidase, partial [Deltaproteobacteria bacterium]|nr:D-alanyl-D-alaninecarboxypeptidase/D-alanyl-D-al anine-endopeptidase [Deltaproteobacteria bacterium]
IISNPAIGPAKIGIIVESMTTGKCIFEYNPDKRLVPASNMKLLTSAAALIVLSPDFHYATRLITNGSVRSGTLFGDLIVEGSGDPTISGYFNYNDPVYVFKDWTKRLAELGINEIRGDLVIDNSAFSENPYGDGWNMDDVNRCFCAPRDAFTFNNNCIQLEIIPSAHNEQGFQFVMEPVSGYIRLVNRLNSRNIMGRDTVRLNYTDPRTLEVTGSKRPGSPETIHYVPVRYPAEFGGFILKETLASGGIMLTGDILCARNCPNLTDITQRKNNGQLRTLAVYRSVRLSDIIKVVNKLSNNLYTEMLLFAIGRTSGKAYTTRNAAAITFQALDTAGIDMSGAVMADGSGLSRYNLVSPRQLARLLQVMVSSPYSGYFYESLPIMSIDGTLSRRLKGSRASGLVRAKTGSIAGVRSLSGYITTYNDENLIFSIISNGHSSTAAIDKVVDRIVLRLLDY